MADDTLKTIAHELTIAIRNNITIDWSVRKSAQASMRKIIKRLLKKYKYPPEQSEKALKIVMRQAEKMCGNVVEEGFWYDRAAEAKGEYRVQGYWQQQTKWAPVPGTLNLMKKSISFGILRSSLKQGPPETQPKPPSKRGNRCWRFLSIWSPAPSKI